MQGGRPALGSQELGEKDPDMVVCAYLQSSAGNSELGPSGACQAAILPNMVSTAS